TLPGALLRRGDSRYRWGNRRLQLSERLDDRLDRGAKRQSDKIRVRGYSRRAPAGRQVPPETIMDILDQLEQQSVYILREAFRHFERLCMLWSIGKDSTVLLWL